jgi:hypothetical protein
MPGRRFRQRGLAEQRDEGAEAGSFVGKTSCRRTQPLRFLVFLILDREPAVLLHATGVLVSVPTPQRFALHKLIVARRRRQGNPERDKDLFQAQDLLVSRRPFDGLLQPLATSEREG